MKRSSLFSPARILFYIMSLMAFFLVIKYLGKLEDIRLLLLQMSAMWLLLALTAQVTTYLLNVLMLRTLLIGNTRTIGFFTLLKLSVVILFINQALPTGGISGNGYIFKQLVKRNIPPRIAFNSLILETLSYYVAFLILLSGFYELYHQQTQVMNPAIRYTVYTGHIFFISLGTLILIVSNKGTISFILPKLNRVSWLRHYIAQTGLLSLSKGKRTNWHSLFHKKKAILITIICQICILCCDGATIYAIMHGFHVQLNLVKMMFGLLLSVVIGSLPISPGALIAYESAMTYFYTLLGIPVHAAIIVTLIFRFFSFWLPIPLGLVLYRNLQRH